ncbi:MAG: prepilin-type N-terminal cleavage/methylation domain-containing protein [Candidatus Omnitrophota bacterium]
MSGIFNRKYAIVCYRAGFALVELLVAISIFSVVMTVVYATLYTSIKAYHRTQGELRLNREVNQILDRLSLELRNCYDAEYDAENDKGGFLADAQSLDFFTIQNIYSQEDFRKTLARFSYNFRDNKLFKKTQVDKDAFLNEVDFPEEELISDIQELIFSYLYFKSERLEKEFEYEWKPEWIDKSRVPRGIRIELVRYDPYNEISLSLKRYIFIQQGEIGTQMPQ